MGSGRKNHAQFLAMATMPERNVVTIKVKDNGVVRDVVLVGTMHYNPVSLQVPSLFCTTLMSHPVFGDVTELLEDVYPESLVPYMNLPRHYSKADFKNFCRT